MDQATRERWEAAGWAVYDDPYDWLGLTAEDRGMVELRVALGRAVAAQRVAVGLTQQELAERVHSTASRVAKVESGCPTRWVSLEFGFRCLFLAGGELTEFAAILARCRPLKPGSSAAATGSRPRSITRPSRRPS
jgi:hypothetical protein